MNNEKHCHVFFAPLNNKETRGKSGQAKFKLVSPRESCSTCSHLHLQSSPARVFPGLSASVVVQPYACMPMMFFAFLLMTRRRMLACICDTRRRLGMCMSCTITRRFARPSEEELGRRFVYVCMYVLMYAESSCLVKR